PPRRPPRFHGWSPPGPSVEFFSEHFPKVQAAARAAGRPADAVSGAAYLTVAFDVDARAAERRLHGFLETYYAMPAQAMMARPATYAGPIQGCAEGMQRRIGAGPPHLAAR